ncbi:calcium-translocating P-type ATPase, SERCA-type [Candidatus Micrarchaeota archaeon CG10_big_fil_rev_8_21_14_0_10_45_29]|nr:MAG: calcium-translocating P-type ATPase, SERCA-type [Candidatus Micrarchaeota archaeon CG10_big_fil_rev_8_21_14_0_10_45_29]
MGNYYNISAKEALEQLNSKFEGLGSAEASRRLLREGENILQEGKKISPIAIFLRQFKSFMVLILIVAAAVSALIGEEFDAIVILVIVVLNAVLGFVQEYKAEKAIEALRKLSAPKARVLRDGHEIEIDSRKLVTGDIIILEAGMRVPADARILEEASLQIDESMLTGESNPSKKHFEAIRGSPSLQDMANMVFMGSNVARGRAKALVCATGMNTEMGKIASLISGEKERDTPMQVKISRMGRTIGYAVLALCAIVFATGVIRDYFSTGSFVAENISSLFLASVALVVAAVPEGLPAIVTISMALGVSRMVKRHALIRRLPSVETLGSTDIICSDKTGTLTKNEMTVRKIFLGGKFISVSGEGYSSSGKFSYDGGGSAGGADLRELLIAGALCNDSKLEKKKGKFHMLGDPTEAALLASASKMKISKKQIDARFARIDEIPFDSKRKMMSTIHRQGKGKIAYVKGAPDVIISKCKYILKNGKAKKINAKERRQILEANEKMASSALRVLAFAYKKMPASSPSANAEQSIVFIGLQAMIDPPRPEVGAAIAKCKKAGIRTIMVTGDFKLTAIAIAKEIGLLQEGDLAIDGSELERMNDSKLSKIIEKVRIFARVSPSHKVRILSALRARGHIVAMTGDGVNDAPALKKADIGVAMGLMGTDVAREASDMVLTDDNFASIVNAVEEGRGVYESIRQFVQYTLSSNLGELLVIFIAVIIGWPLPLIAIQILWINLLTDGLPGLALGLDPHSKDIMAASPRRRHEDIITSNMVENVLLLGCIMGAGTLFLYSLYGIGSAIANSVAFSALIIFQMFHVLTYKAQNFCFDFIKNKFVSLAIIISILLQIVVLYTPLNALFKTVPLGVSEWVAILLVSSTAFIIPQARQLFSKMREKSAAAKISIA